MKKVLVFGTFDMLHDGHRFFLEFARLHGDTLIASVADDSVVERTKKRLPTHTTLERMRYLEKEGLVDRVIHGDRELGTWSAIHTEAPDSIVIGYDQDALHDALVSLKENTHLDFAIVRAPGFQGDVLHTSLLRESQGGVQ